MSDPTTTPPDQCPEPFWHKTHHYCPWCTFVSEEAKMRELEAKTIAAIPAKQQEVIEEQHQRIADLESALRGREQSCAALEAELERVTAVQGFNADWERMYCCATNHERISFVGENCPLCRAEAAVGFKDDALDGMHAQLREAEAERDEYAAVLKAIHDNPEGNVEQLQAELALRDRMLRDIIERIALTPERWNGWTTEEVLTDLRARAEEATDAT